MKSNHQQHQPVRFFSETLGLAPFLLRLKQAKVALLGDEDVPKSKFGISSLKQLRPSIGIPLWSGKAPYPRQVLITNLFNHTPTPIEEGWSVEINQTKDFRGKKLTYNSHNATDLAIPIGTTVVAAAPGEVVAIKSEFNRGGLKIFIDHGMGLMTSYVHLARSLVNVGDPVARSTPIAISGYSGLDGFITFPFGVPHVHFNTWLNGFPIDPFPYSVEGKEFTSLWKTGVIPSPAKSLSFDSENFIQSAFDINKLNKVTSGIKTESVRKRILEIQDIKTRAFETMIEMNYYPTRFKIRESFYVEQYERKPILDLPFLDTEFDGVKFIDELNQNGGSRQT